MLTHEMVLREIMFGVWCSMNATKTTWNSGFTRFYFKATWKFRSFFEFTRYFLFERVSHRRSLAAVVLCSRFAESDATVTPSVTCVAWLHWWYIHSADFVHPSTALIFVTKRNSTSPSVIQVKTRESSISIAEKLDVISQVKKGEGIIDICCNIRFAPLAFVHFVVMLIELEKLLIQEIKHWFV